MSNYIFIDADKLKAAIERRKGYISVTHFAEELLSIINSLQQEQKSAEWSEDERIRKEITKKLYDLGADLIKHKPYSFNRGVNVGMTRAYDDILNILNNTRKEE